MSNKINTMSPVTEHTQSLIVVDMDNYRDILLDSLIVYQTKYDFIKSSKEWYERVCYNHKPPQNTLAQWFKDAELNCEGYEIKLLLCRQILATMEIMIHMGDEPIMHLTLSDFEIAMASKNDDISWINKEIDIMEKSRIDKPMRY